MGDFAILGFRILVITALLVSIYRYKQISKTSLRNFGYYFAMVILIETGAYFSDDRRIDNIFYTIFDVLMFSFFILWFYEVLSKRIYVIRLLVLYFVLLLISFIVEDISKPLIIAQTGGTIILFYLTVRFYVRLLNSDEVVQFLRLAEFWITIGLLIFNLGYLPLSWAIKLDISITREISLILTFFTNAVLYSCFIKAMLCPMKK